MNTYVAIKKIYPDLEDDKFIILDNKIYKWDTELLRPTEEELQTAWETVEIPPDPLNEPSDVDKLRVENVQLKSELETVKSVLDFIIINY